MIVERVELIALQPCLVIDQSPITAQLVDEDVIAQALCGDQVSLVLGKTQLEIRVNGGHFS